LVWGIEFGPHVLWAARGVVGLVLASHVAALRVQLNVTLPRATTMVFLGVMARKVLEQLYRSYVDPLMVPPNLIF
jgi:hypothetical protein